MDNELKVLCILNNLRLTYRLCFNEHDLFLYNIDLFRKAKLLNVTLFLSSPK